METTQQLPTKSGSKADDTEIRRLRRVITAMSEEAAAAKTKADVEIKDLKQRFRREKVITDGVYHWQQCVGKLLGSVQQSALYNKQQKCVADDLKKRLAAARVVQAMLCGHAARKEAATTKVAEEAATAKAEEATATEVAAHATTARTAKRTAATKVEEQGAATKAKEAIATEVEQDATTARAAAMKVAAASEATKIAEEAATTKAVNENYVRCYLTETNKPKRHVIQAGVWSVETFKAKEAATDGAYEDLAREREQTGRDSRPCEIVLQAQLMQELMRKLDMGGVFGMGPEKYRHGYHETRKV